MSGMGTYQGSGLTELRRGVVEYCVLSLLSTAEMYGFQLVQTLAGHDGLVTSEGTMYPLLGRLHDAGLVTTTWRQDGPARPRKYYALTAAGFLALAEFRRDWARFRDTVDQVLSESEEHTT